MENRKWLNRFRNSFKRKHVDKNRETESRGCTTVTVKDNKIGNHTINVPGGTVHNYGEPAGTSTTTDLDIDYCPTPVATFVGRSKELKKLRKLIVRKQVIVLSGMGGIGKTQMSRQYGLNYKKHYRYRYWLESDTPEKLVASFNELAEKLHIKLSNKNALVNDVYKALENEPTLLIFDNVEKPEHVFDYLPMRVGISDANVHVLITSRWGGWDCDQVECYHLQPLDKDTVRQLFKIKFGKAYKKGNRKDWKTLARNLGYLPLALQVASSYLQKRLKVNPDLRAVLANYVGKLKKGTADLVKDHPMDYIRSIYNSMLLTLKELEEDTDIHAKVAFNLLNVAAYLNPDEIEGEELLKLVEGDDKSHMLEDALITIMDYSLLSKGLGEYYTINRIIQSCFRYNQVENGTSDHYYKLALDFALTKDHNYKHVFEFADEQVSIIHKYYEQYPGSELLQRLVRNKCYDALNSIFETKNNAEMESIIKDHTLIHSAVLSGDKFMLELFFNYEADINQRNSKGFTPLQIASRKGNLEIVQWLLKKEASPSEKDLTGKTSLHSAAEKAYHEILAILIETDKSTLDLTDDGGNTPLLVIPYENTSIDDDQILSTVQILIENGSNVTITNKQGLTVLHCAARGARANVISRILQLNKELIHKVDEKGRTALHVIGDTEWHVPEACIDRTACVLADNGLSFHKQNNDGKTPLETVKPEYKAILQKVDEQRNQPIKQQHNNEILPITT